MNCYTIPADKPFIPHLAGWILDTYGKDAAELTKILVLLPNRRACRALREAFLEITGGKPLLLPRIQPLGDVEEGITIHYDPDRADIPPAISSIRREFLLTQLVMEFKNKQSEAVSGRVFNIEQAAELARQLARFMDEVARFGVSFDRLSELVPDELQKHWQQTLDFLKIISHEWPRKLDEQGVLDPIEHRNRLLNATAKAWQKHPPSYPIIAAGSTGSSPATATLLSTIARLPQGKVILPALDTAMPKREWDCLIETHPQFALKHLLETMECDRSQVHSLWAESEEPARVQCLRAIFQSPEATSGWAELQLPLAQGLNNIGVLVAETLHDEARMIAVALRKTLDTPAKTAALVTPDRTLARMVASQMQRFGVEIDDSAGHAVSDTPTGSLMRLLIEMVAGKAAPSALLSLLRHPLAAAGKNTSECRALSRTLEITVLRGLRRAPGLQPLHDACADNKVRELLASLNVNLKPLFDCFAQKKVALRTLLEAHIACCEWLATTDTDSGPQRLWAGESGNALSTLLSELLASADILGEIDPANYAGLFEVLLAGHSYYPRFGMHPRLHILSPMEARLQHFEMLILGGLNEGTWPAPSEIDPWMSRPMRHAFKLPPVQRAIGQSAHDVYLMCASGEILLTRSQKVDGTPTIPSRWLVRLETLVGGIDEALYDSMNVNPYYEEAKRQLDKPDILPAVSRPQPKPVVALRPRKLRVTAIDRYLSDPYWVYARYILNVKKLDELDQDPDAADFGEMVHEAMERFVAQWPSALPDDPLTTLIQCGRDAFAPKMIFPAVASLWWPRFEAIAVWLIEQERKRRGQIKEILAEISGEWNFDIDGKPFTLTTRIDRLEVSNDGTITLVDYKTGSIPSKADIEHGENNQLMLEALITVNGQLKKPLPVSPVIQGLQYWKLSGRAESAKIMDADIKHIAAAQIRLEGLIRTFDQESQSYAPPTFTSDQNEKYNDYAHLTRRQEWGDV